MIMFKKNQAITLIELLVSVIVIAIMVLSLYSINIFSRKRLFNTERRTILQNELSFALEHMSKYVAQGIGDISSPPITAIANGFRVRVDTGTPANSNDDYVVQYLLTGNILSSSCFTAPCPANVTQTLSNKIVSIAANVYNDDDLVISGGGNAVDVLLVGRYDPADINTGPLYPKNPQVEMKTKIVCNSASTN